MTPPRWQTRRQRPVPQPVINVQTPEVHVQVVSPFDPAPAKRAQTGLGRAWSVAKVAGPAVASAAALVISLLAYADQHGADSLQAQAQVAADAAALRHDADQVSFTTGDHGPPTIVNASTGDISYIQMTVTEIDESKPWIDHFPPVHEATLYMTHLAPCTTDQIRLITEDKIKVTQESMTFADHDGNDWMLTPDGRLTRLPRLPGLAQATNLDIPINHYATSPHCA